MRSAGAFRFEDVSFAYRDDEPILTDLSFRIAPGEHVALVGPSGAGKSTLFQLLLRFYDPLQGQISLGGIDIRQLALADLRQHIGVVLQDSVIFGSSALENIRYGKAEATDDECIAAAKLAAADLAAVKAALQPLLSLPSNEPTLDNLVALFVCVNPYIDHKWMSHFDFRWRSQRKMNR